MGIIELYKTSKPVNVYHARPGPVGPVGAVNVRPRFRQSSATLPWAFDPYWSGKRADKLGSNIQDGHVKNHLGNGPASTNNKAWNGNRSFKHKYGYSIHDVQSADLSVHPILSSLPQFSWKRKVARTRNVKGGSLFLPMGYTATGKPRGGLYPTSQGYGGITPASTAYDPDKAPKVVLDPNGPKPVNPLNDGPSTLGIQNRIGNLRL